MTRPSGRKSVKSEPGYYHDFQYDSHEQYLAHCRAAVRAADTERQTVDRFRPKAKVFNFAQTERAASP
jgi:hypothetical protein